MIKHISRSAAEQTALVLEYQKAPNTEKGGRILGILFQANVKFFESAFSQIKTIYGIEEYKEILGEMFFKLKIAADTYDVGKNNTFNSWLGWRTRNMLTEFYNEKGYLGKERRCCGNCAYQGMKSYCCSCKGLSNWLYIQTPPMSSIDVPYKQRENSGCFEFNTPKDRLEDKTPPGKYPIDPIRAANGKLTPNQRVTLKAVVKAAELYGAGYGASEGKTQYLEDRLGVSRYAVELRIKKMRHILKPIFIQAGYNLK